MLKIEDMFFEGLKMQMMEMYGVSQSSDVVVDCGKQVDNSRFVKNKHDQR